MKVSNGCGTYPVRAARRRPGKMTLACYALLAGVFLLASVLQRFLGLYSAVNSFSRLTAKTKRGVLKQWAPMAGEQMVL